MPLRRTSTPRQPLLELHTPATWSASPLSGPYVQTTSAEPSPAPGLTPALLIAQASSRSVRSRRGMGGPMRRLGVALVVASAGALLSAAPASAQDRDCADFDSQAEA